MLETGGSAHQQHSRGDRADHLEAVRNFAWSEHVCARSAVDPFAIADECHFAFKHIKCPVFEMVDMIWGSKARRHRPMLHEAECSIRRFADGPHESGYTQEPEWRVFPRVHVRL